MASAGRWASDAESRSRRASNAGASAADPESFGWSGTSFGRRSPTPVACGGTPSPVVAVPWQLRLRSLEYRTDSTPISTRECALERFLPWTHGRNRPRSAGVSGSLGLDAFTSEEGSGEMAFRLSVNQASDLTTIGIAGRLGADAVVLLGEACGGARRPLVLDLSDLTSASNAGVLLLRRLASEGVHLLGASRYLRFLLEPMSRTPACPHRPGRPVPHHRRRADAVRDAGHDGTLTPLPGRRAARRDDPAGPGRSDAAAFSALSNAITLAWRRPAEGGR